MLTKIRPWNRPGVPYAEIEHEPDDCPFCKAGREMCQWPPGCESTHFLESESGELHRVSGANLNGIVVMECELSNKQKAHREISRSLRRQN